MSEAIVVHEVISPDGNVVVRVALQDGELLRGQAPSGCPFYAVSYKGQERILESQLGLEMGGMAEFSSSFEVVDVRRASQDSSWMPPYGERRVIPEHYNELVVDLHETAWPCRYLTLAFRAYNEGAAWRYTIPEQSGLDHFAITVERTRFCFPKGTIGYAEWGTEGEYEPMPIEEIRPGCERPLTVVYPDGGVACLTEAYVHDYARMLLSPTRGSVPTLVSDLSGTVRGRTPFDTPWRVLIVGDRPGDLIENNHIILNLNPPCEMEDTSWLKPGKVMRDTTLSTENAKAIVDFCVAHGLDYVHFDWGWYGPPENDDTDATTVDVVIPMKGTRPEGHTGLDMPGVIAYARERGIGVWLYVNRQACERQLDRFLPVYEEWGIVGIKPGFVRVGAQEWTLWLHELVVKAAKHHLMVDVHDGYRPTGFTRTYPNLLTQEGIRGNEHMPTARHNCTLPFARFPAGAGDYTPAYYSPRIQTTHAHQLAMAVVVYSPAMYLFWYDKPDMYQGEPEVEFWEHVKTVWDDTRVLHGEIGEYATIVRQSGEEWFIGSITNETERQLAIPLAFLQPGKDYLAHIYRDAPEGTNRTNVIVEERRVNSQTVIDARLLATGGHAMWIHPIE